jgi:DNA polymerase-3 subunit delta'
LNRAYLEVTRLVSLADDKEKQSQAFRLMELALEEQLRLSRSQQLLEKLSHARRMWKANVSFQNALEYMVLSLES